MVAFVPGTALTFATKGRAIRPKTTATKPRSLWHRLAQPETTASLLLAGKAALAATTAWALSVGVLDTDVVFMAPWTAMLTVHATVHRSLSRGAQTTVAVVIGMGLAFVMMQVFGVSVWTFGIAIFLGLLGSRLSWIRDEGVAIATTAIFVFSSDHPMFADRFLELVVGVVVGVAVNFLVVPPLKDQQAKRYVDSVNRRMGALLVEMGEAFEDSWETDCADSWVEQTESITAELDSAWQMVRLARESRRQNPRKFLRKGQPDDVDYEAILLRIDEAVSHLRNMSRTIRDTVGLFDTEAAGFRRSWAAVTRQLGEALADPQRDMATVERQLDDVTGNISAQHDLARIQWPVYGAMLTSLRNIIRLFS